jgi:hypothetical protein
MIEQASDLEDGKASVKELIELLLPNLRAVMLVGQKAAKARSAIETISTPKLRLFTSDHPSPRVKARWPKRWKAIPSEWRKVVPLIT